MDIFHKEFVLRGAPTEWHDYATELFEAAESLCDAGNDAFSISSDERGIIRRPAYSRATIFLFALSIENLLKGILIAENPSYISNGCLSKEVSGGFHSLVLLNKKIKSTPLNKADVSILKVLESSIPSWGRYPIPKYYKSMALEKVIDKKFRKRVKNIFRKLEKSFYLKLRSGWKGPHGVTLKSISNSEYSSESFQNDSD